MAKPKIAYVCGACGASFSKWQGQCGECGAWNSLGEFRVGPTRESAPRRAGYSGGDVERGKRLDQ
ncbi:MAG TPA: DNA repair protein RadA, partial [Xanthomonadaceae bacterium]|nr:DNA repair protein RadA [Xanthomonadaceae bacterium]